MDLLEVLKVNEQSPWQINGKDVTGAKLFLKMAFEKPEAPFTEYDGRVGCLFS